LNIYAFFLLTAVLILPYEELQCRDVISVFRGELKPIGIFQNLGIFQKDLFLFLLFFTPRCHIAPH